MRSFVNELKESRSTVLFAYKDDNNVDVLHRKEARDVTQRRFPSVFKSLAVESLWYSFRSLRWCYKRLTSLRDNALLRSGIKHASLESKDPQEIWINLR